MVLLGLMLALASDPDRQATVEARALGWLRGMQSRDGGFAAFDADNDWSLLNSVPFSDHNAMLDPTWPDITGRMLSCLGARGATQDDAAVSRAVAYLLRTQEEDGTWYGRWGVAYIYGTFLALGGLRAVGFAVEAVYERAAQKILSVQNTDGGWGESCKSYNNTGRGIVKRIYHPYAGFSLPKRDRIWSSLFHQLDRFFKIWERRGFRELRIAAIRHAERWVLDRMRSSVLVALLRSLGQSRGESRLPESTKPFHRACRNGG